NRNEYTLASMYGAAGLKFYPFNWSNDAKAAAIAHLRRLFADGRIGFSHEPRLIKELLTFQERILPSGRVGYGARGQHHDDCVALLMTEAMADLEGYIKSSPYKRRT